MRLGKNFGPGSIYEQLGRFAKMIVVPGVTVGNLVYASSRDGFSKDTFALSSGVITAGTELQFWQTGVGKTGGAYTTGQTLTQTNFLGDKGQMPANVVYIMTHLGFAVEAVSTADPSTAATSTNVNPVCAPNTLLAILEQFVVRLSIGRGVDRRIGKLMDFPQCSMGWAVFGDNVGSGAGAPDVNWMTNCSNGAAEGLVELPLPIVFPPLVDVSLLARAEAAVTVNAVDAGASSRFQVVAHCHGIELTMPVA